MKLYLHVGPHKTGTTLIQKTMLDNQGLLLQKGLFYPKGFLSIFGHHEFRNKVKGREITEDDVSFLKHTGKNVLLSSEDFISLNEDDFRYLKERLVDFEIEVIYAWRRANKKLFSIWQEYVKHGGQDTFFEYHFPHIARPATSAMLSPDIKLKMFARVFNKKNIKIIDYDAALKTDSLLDTFFGLLKVENYESFSIPTKDKNASNKSLDFFESELIRALNVYYFRAKGIEGPEVRLAYTEHKQLLNQENLKYLLQQISSDAISVDASKYFVDQRSEKVMKETFMSQIVNFEENPLLSEFNVSSQKWLLDPHNYKLFANLCNELSELTEQ